MRILVLFVHGFLGDENSFQSFPVDLRDALGMRSVHQLEFRVVPSFESKGNIDRAVYALYNWLAMNAVQYSGVVLVGHSMGGLIVSEAYRLILGHSGVRSQETISTVQAEPGNIRHWSTGSPMVPCRGVTTNRVRVLGILCYDSPFCGLNSTVFSVAAGSKAQELLDSSVPPESTPRVVLGQIGTAISNVPSAITGTGSYIASSSSSLIMNAPGAVYSSVQSIASYMPSFNWTESQAAEYAREEQERIIDLNCKQGTKDGGDKRESTSGSGSGGGVSEESANVNATVIASALSATTTFGQESQQVESVVVQEITESTSMEIHPVEQQLEIVEPKRLDPLPVPQTTDYSALLTAGLTTAAVATGAYYTGGFLALRSMTLIRSLAVAYAVSHAKEAGKHIRFLYPLWGETTQEAEDRIELLSSRSLAGELVFKCFYVRPNLNQQDATDELKRDNRTFIKMPPKRFAHLFTPIGSDYADEISAHMGMFDRIENPGHYWELVDATAKQIRLIVNPILNANSTSGSDYESNIRSNSGKNSQSDPTIKLNSDAL